MKKRLMILLAVGISFAPPVFAREAQPLVPGELKISQQDGRGIVCALQREKGDLSDDQQSPRQARESTAVLAN